jgi:diguanylate cyclase
MLSSQLLSLALAVPRQSTREQPSPCCPHCGQPEDLWALDELTRALNRWGWNAAAPAALNKAVAGGRLATLLMLDVDNFKTVNDSQGHVIGDEVLRLVAACLLQEVADGGLVARLGGDEFAMLLPSNDLRAAASTANQLRHRVRAMSMPGGCGTTVSVGAASTWHGSDQGSNLAKLVMDADRALLSAKRAGRDTTRWAV